MFCRLQAGTQQPRLPGAAATATCGPPWPTASRTGRRHISAASAQVSTPACSHTSWYPQLTVIAAAEPSSSHLPGAPHLCAPAGSGCSGASDRLGSLSLALKCLAQLVSLCLPCARQPTGDQIWSTPARQAAFPFCHLCCCQLRGVGGNIQQGALPLVCRISLLGT